MVCLWLQNARVILTMGKSKVTNDGEARKDKSEDTQNRGLSF